MTIHFQAQIKQISVKNLVSGDKEARVLLIVAPSDISEANKLADLEAGELVKVVYEKTA